MASNKYKYDVDIYKFEEKSTVVEDHIGYMLNRTQSMFKWSGLPDNIPQRSLELFLQTNGNCIFAKSPTGELCIYTGGLGGEPNYLYLPTLYTVANPAQNFSRNYIIDEDCVLVLNDSMNKGLLPMFRKYATMLMENELSLSVADINTRMPFLLSASDDKTVQSAKQFLEDIKTGKLGVVTDSAFLDGVKEHLLSTQQHAILSQLIQYEQYIKASWFNDLGLNANFNGMKKEAISDSEQAMNEDVLLPLIDNMLEQRQIACEKINSMFGTNISVELNSSWEDNEEEIELEHEALEQETEEDTEVSTEEDDQKEEEKEDEQKDSD